MISRKKIGSISIIIILLLIGALYYYQKVENYKYTNYNYELQITTQNKNENYTLYVPILFPYTGKNSIKMFDEKFLANTELHRDVESIDINRTEHGETLQINSSGDILLNSKFKAENDGWKLYIFSTRRENKFMTYKSGSFKGDYWVYYNCSQNTEAVYIKISYTWGDRDFNSKGVIEGYLYPIGWQWLNGTEIHTITD